MFAGPSLVPLVLVAVLAMVRSAGAAVPAPLNRMTHALSAVHSYHGLTTARSTLPGLTLVVSTDTVVVRHGEQVQIYAVETVRARSRTTRTETVTTGARTCERRSPHATFDCHLTPMDGSPDAPRGLLDQSLRELGAGVRWTAAGLSVVRGQLCLTYRVAGPTGQSVSRGTLWISRATMLPVAMTVTTSSAIPGHTSSLTIVDTVAWRDWNLRTLAIPSV